MDFKDIMDFISNHGIKGSIGVIVLFLIFTMIKAKWFEDLLTNVSDKFLVYFIKKKVSPPTIKLITESDIVNHDIFNYIDFWLYSKIPTFKFSSDYRTAVFRKYLDVYLREYKNELSNNINSKLYQDMDDSLLWKNYMALLNNIVFSYEKEMANIGIPTVIIEKMKVKNNDTISLTIDLIQGVCGSQFYTSEKNLLKVYSILNIMLSVLESTISNSENVCNAINGQLRGLNYNGFTEP